MSGNPKNIERVIKLSTVVLLERINDQITGQGQLQQVQKGQQFENFMAPVMPLMGQYQPTMMKNGGMPQFLQNIQTPQQMQQLGGNMMGMNGVPQMMCMPTQQHQWGWPGGKFM